MQASASAKVAEVSVGDRLFPLCSYRLQALGLFRGESDLRYVHHGTFNELRDSCGWGAIEWHEHDKALRRAHGHPRCGAIYASGDAPTIIRIHRRAGVPRSLAYPRAFHRRSYLRSSTRELRSARQVAAQLAGRRSGAGEAQRAACASTSCGRANINPDAPRDRPRGRATRQGRRERSLRHRRRCALCGGRSLVPARGRRSDLRRPIRGRAAARRRLPAKTRVERQALASTSSSSIKGSMQIGSVAASGGVGRPAARTRARSSLRRRTRPPSHGMIDCATTFSKWHPM